MSYVLERAGLAACPDDHARVGDPDDGMTAAQETQLAQWKDAYAYCVRENVKETLHGRTTGTTVLCGGNLHFYSAKDIAELLQDGISPDDLVVLLAATFNPAAADKARVIVSKLIDDLAERTGERLAESKASQEWRTS